jgi:hypothetical protein
MGGTLLRGGADAKARRCNCLTADCEVGLRLGTGEVLLCSSKMTLQGQLHLPDARSACGAWRLTNFWCYSETCLQIIIIFKS